ncbi:DUF6994 family protein [Arthrobacter sp. TB 26]|uniref:DUF6994 family protein n=1 Tax=Arthrobacter sp. TB 26 TaxID=494420 RepID=UPI000FE14431|nr:hypothetical protein [Arthrobacter sp. TB 26]
MRQLALQRSPSGVGTGSCWQPARSYDTEGVKVELHHLVWSDARGFHPRIADRPDLTLECIRRHYLGELPNPLAKPLARYSDFFALFKTFREYVEFFLLQDLLEEDGQNVRSFLHPIADFRTKDAVPKDGPEYLTYLENSNAFISARNRRIDEQP